MLCCSIVSATASLALSKTTMGCRDAHEGPGAQGHEARDPQDAGSMLDAGVAVFGKGLVAIDAGEADACEQARRRWKKTCRRNMSSRPPLHSR